MKEKYLPIGTVVLLTNGTKKVMITGYLPIDVKNYPVPYLYSNPIEITSIIEYNYNN